MFPEFMKLLREQRRILEYEMTRLRSLNLKESDAALVNYGV